MTAASDFVIAAAVALAAYLLGRHDGVTCQKQKWRSEAVALLRWQRNRLADAGQHQAAGMVADTAEGVALGFIVVQRGAEDVE